MKLWHILVLIFLVFVVVLVPTLVINQETARHSARRVSPGINLGPAFDSAEAAGVWSDGSTLWVVDDTHRELIPYDLATGAHLPKRKIPLDRTNIGPTGVWSDGRVIWVADWDEHNLFAYNLATGIRLPFRDIHLHEENHSPEGIAGHHNTIFVVDRDDTHVYAYGKLDGHRKPALEFDLRDANDHPWGIWANDAQVWVADHRDRILYGYSAISGESQPSFDLRLPVDNRDPRGIWADDNTFWVVDHQDTYVYAVRYRDFRHADDEIEIFAVQSPGGIWTDGETMWVADASHLPNRRIAAYRVADGVANPDRDIHLDPDNWDPSGIWSDGTHVWVADTDDRMLYVYGLAADGQRFVSRDQPLSPDNSDPRGIWSDGETMWVSDSDDDRLYAYNLASRSQRLGKEFDLAPENRRPGGIWSDGQTIWVLDIDDRLAYAYDLDTGRRVIEAEFRTVPDNDQVAALTGHRHRFWVSDTNDQLLYSYGKANAPPVFPEYAISFNVHHSLPGGAAIGAVPKADDPDGDTLTYELQGADADLFKFDSHTSLISYAGDPPGPPSGERYFLSLSVTDGKNALNHQDTSEDDSINVRIDIVPNGPPVFNITDGETITVPIDAPPGQVVAVADASDPDGDTLTYSILGFPRPPLLYGRGRFILPPGASLDDLSRDAYQLTLLVRDGKDQNGDPQMTWDDQVDVIIQFVSDNPAGSIASTSPPTAVNRQPIQP